MQAFINGRVELPDESPLGSEFLLRVRVYEIQDELVEVTALGDAEPRIERGLRTCEVQFIHANSVGVYADSD